MKVKEVLEWGARLMDWLMMFFGVTCLSVLMFGILSQTHFGPDLIDAALKPYKILLVEDYFISKSSGQGVVLAKALEDNPHAFSTIIPNEVVKVGFNDHHIVVETAVINQTVTDSEGESNVKSSFYILDVETGELSRPLTKGAFQQNDVAQKIPLQRLENFEKIYK